MREMWGCDIDGPSIRWAIRNLSPPFRFFQISETPSIPFEADSFDLVHRHLGPEPHPHRLAAVG